ncbi:MAG: type II toxin-antitoxin system RelE/ParE family toxin [Chroococcidiopsidaceae cyanobacterium CP_BM_ER_R8_30]|nr:type II toxin-antitoxin system RelE/ParE family toxin [Chroococcidiopsidaceae cyanobacterium CP_BM_ER_R8_30]
MPVKWLRKALRNLEQIQQYVTADDPEAAIQVVLRIQGAVQQLETFPMMGKAGRVDGTRELVIPNTSFIVIYRVQGKTVQILRILHTSKKYPD